MNLETNCAPNCVLRKELIASPTERPNKIFLINPVNIEATLNITIEAIKKIIQILSPITGKFAPNELTVPNMRGVIKSALATVTTSPDLRKSVNLPICTLTMLLII